MSRDEIIEEVKETDSLVDRAINGGLWLTLGDIQRLENWILILRSRLACLECEEAIR